jgi:hypothetical protein
MLRWVVSLLATSALACGGFGQWSPEDSGVEPGDAKASADTGSPGYDANIANPSDAGTSDVLVASDADYSTPEVCTSGEYWTLGTTKSASMQPGIACRSCHVVLGQASSYDFDISGTVYPTAHEPDQCNGVADPMNVVITDANGTDHVLPVNNVGNFYNNDALGFLKIPTPYTAKVVSGAGTRPMISAQTNGDCNSCHTEAGTMLAPGRIMAP